MESHKLLSLHLLLYFMLSLFKDQKPAQAGKSYFKLRGQYEVYLL